jgi:choice-of-anchor B domain-containing protein
VDFLSFISIQDMNISSDSFPGGSETTADVWGWYSPTGREITIACLDNGVALIDSTVPVHPIVLGTIQTGKNRAAWCDVKVFRNTLYIVKDQNSDLNTTYGIEVFNLTRLVDLESVNATSFPISFSPDFIYTQHGRAHNLAINVDTGFLYSVGSATCNGGLHMIDLNENPLVPTFSGCASEDGYTHDAQCILYDGPDVEFQGKEICFGFNEDSITIYDVSNKNSPVVVNRFCYPGTAYTHQGSFHKEKGR